MRFYRVLAAVSLASLVCASVAWTSGFGINAHIPSTPVADRIQAAGIGWVRIDFLWSLAEPERDVYDWSVYDALVNRLESHGLQIFAGLGATPGWATSGAEFSGVPDDIEQWREFCYLAAHRYAGRIQAWGLWNEPNLGRFWQGTRQQYIDVILVPGAQAVRLGDPSALVCAPDLAHLSSADWDSWLDATIRAAEHDLDVVTHHVYPSNGWASEVTYDLETGGPFPFSPPSVEEVLQNAGWWRRPFWLTESGVESGRWGEGRQAFFVEELLHQWFAPTRGHRSWVDRVFFYEMNDSTDPSGTTWGLVFGPPEFVAKESYISYSEFIADELVDDAELVSSDVPRYFRFGEVEKSTITFSNTGTTPWSSAEVTWLTVEIDSPGWFVEVEQIPPEETIKPGESHAYHLAITPPSAPFKDIGSDPVLWARIERQGAWPFGEPLRHDVVVSHLPPPEIIRQPVSRSVVPGATTTLHVESGGGEPLSFRWLRNGNPVIDSELFSGSDTATLAVTALSHEVAAFYQCAVTNAVGEVVSETAVVDIGHPAPRRGGSRVSPDPPTRAHPMPVHTIRYSGPPDPR